VSLVASLVSVATTIVASAQAVGFGATSMMKKRIHNHDNNQTNPKNNPKPNTSFKKQPEKMFLHTKLLQQPKETQ
jgi:hypothetical protein